MSSLKVDLNNQFLLLNYFNMEDAVREKARLSAPCQILMNLVGG